VLAREASSDARCHLAYAGVRHAFTTRNLNEEGRSVPCSWWMARSRTWTGSGSSAPEPARHHRRAPGLQDPVRARYAFSSKALEAVVSPVFDRIANTFVDSFVQRAEPLVRVELVWSPGAADVRHRWLTLEEGATLESALRGCVDFMAAQHLPLEQLRLGVWGR
jgi:hypothetical protein